MQATFHIALSPAADHPERDTADATSTVSKCESAKHPQSIVADSAVIRGHGVQSWLARSASFASIVAKRDGSASSAASSAGGAISQPSKGSTIVSNLAAWAVATTAQCRCLRSALGQTAIDVQARRGMRAPGDTMPPEFIAQAAADFCIRYRHCADFFAQARDVAAQLTQPFHVAGIAHVHCRSERRDTRSGQPLSGRQVILDRCIGIGGQHDAVDGQAHAPCPDTGKAIAEVAGRNHETQWLAGLPPVFQAGFGVVGSLRQQATDIDAVGRTEPMCIGQLPVGKRFLDQALAIVEFTAHRQRDHIVTPAGELMLLTRRYPAQRKQHDHAHPRPPVIGRSHCTAGIAGGGDHDRHRWLWRNVRHR